MKNRKKRAQREEVRKILHAMRLELAARRAVQETNIHQDTLQMGELLTRLRRMV